MRTAWIITALFAALLLPGMSQAFVNIQFDLPGLDGTFTGSTLELPNGESMFEIDLFPTQVYNLTHVPCDLDPWWIVSVAGVAVGLGLIVSGIPAWRAARHDPLQSLRNE